MAPSPKPHQFQLNHDDVNESDGIQSGRSSFDDWLENEPMPDNHSSISLVRTSADLPAAYRRTSSPNPVMIPVAQDPRVTRIRWMMLASACCLSIGSHFGGYLLGPLKGRLKGAESGFAALVSASQLVNTITPLVAGGLVPKYGAAKCGLVATGLVLMGQLIVCWGEREGAEQSVASMAWGLGIYGLGIAPLSVCQESIILASKRSDSKAVGRSVAMGLLLGKLASFAAASTAEPLADISPRLPFITASFLSLFSFTACLFYTYLERCLPPPIAEGEGGGAPHSRKHGKLVGTDEIASFGDSFWLYLLVCSLAGAWFTSIHLSSSLLKTIYNVPSAALVSSSILFASVVLYPAVGWLVDKRPHILSTLYKGVTSLMVSTFIVLLFFSGIVPLPLAVLPLALGIGPAALLLVLVVPRIVHPHQIPTALGLHKSAEMAGAVIIQAGASWLLASSEDKVEAAFRVVKQLLVLCTLQLVTVIIWWRGIDRRAAQSSTYDRLPTDVQAGLEMQDSTSVVELKTSRSEAESLRGGRFLLLFGGFIAAAWIVYGVNLANKN